MAVLLPIEFETYVDAAGYKLTKGRDHDRLGPLIVGKGGPMMKRRPLEFFPHLYREFAKIEIKRGSDGADAFVDFVSKYGPIAVPPSEKGTKQSLVQISRCWAAMRGAVHQWQRDDQGEQFWLNAFASVHAVLRPAADGKRAIHLIAPTLYDAMVAQFLQAVASDATLQTCQQCGNWFEVGPTGKRSGTRFCSDECRTKYHNERRSVEVTRKREARRYGK